MIQHTRSTFQEAWIVLFSIAVISPILGTTFLLIDDGLWTVFGVALVLLCSAAGIAHAVKNFRTPGVFLCRVTDESIVQSMPIKSAGESFEVKLSEITKIEKHHRLYTGGGEEWYIHTESGRYLISKAYGNPYRCIGAAIQRRLPYIEAIQTKSKT